MVAPGHNHSGKDTGFRPTLQRAPARCPGVDLGLYTLVPFSQAAAEQPHTGINAVPALTLLLSKASRELESTVIPYEQFSGWAGSVRISDTHPWRGRAPAVRWHAGTSTTA